MCFFLFACWYDQFSSVQSLSHVQLFATPCTPGLPVHHQLLELTQTHVHWVGDAIQPSHPLSSPSPPSIFPSIRVFSNESVLCIRWPKYLSFSISPSNECSGLISFRMDWFDLLAILGTQESSPTGVGCHVLLQGIFPTQELNPGLPNCWLIPYHLSNEGCPNRWLTPVY